VLQISVGWDGPGETGQTQAGNALSTQRFLGQIALGAVVGHDPVVLLRNPTSGLLDSLHRRSMIKDCWERLPAWAFPALPTESCGDHVPKTPERTGTSTGTEHMNMNKSFGVSPRQRRRELELSPRERHRDPNASKSVERRKPTVTLWLVGLLLAAAAITFTVYSTSISWRNTAASPRIPPETATAENDALAFNGRDDLVAMPAYTKKSEPSAAQIAKEETAKLQAALARARKVPEPSHPLLRSRSPIRFVKHTLDSSFARAAHVDAVDLDGDGDIDIFASTNRGTGTTWWENDGVGNFAEHPIAEGWTLRPRDRDGDGDLDLAGHSNETDETAWWANDGRGNFTRHKLPDRLHLRSTIDADSDGDLDFIGCEKEEGGIVAWWENTGVAWWENTGKDVFVKHVLDREFRSPWWSGIVDMDRDGDADLLACAAGANQIAWWETRGDGVFVKHVVDGSFRGVKRLCPIDIDQDGDLDIAGAAFGAGHVAWFENDGSQNFTKHLIDTNLSWAHSVCALDMDTDGDVDVVACGINAPRHVVWYENDGQQSFSSHTVDSSFTTAWYVAAADFDGDGDGDIVAASVHRNEVAWWRSEANR
jgi:VCBS repeat protein